MLEPIIIVRQNHILKSPLNTSIVYIIIIYNAAESGY